MTNKKQPKYKVKILITCLVLAVIAVVCYVNIDLVIVSYWRMFKYDKFDAGDKVYVSQDYFNDKDVNALGTWELLRPLTKVDLDTLQATRQEKMSIAAQMNDGLKPYLKNLGPAFDLQKMAACKTGIIGVFKGYYLKHRKDNSGRYYVWGIFAKIEPNAKVFDNSRYSFYAPPKNYTVADSDIYVSAGQISNAELTNVKVNRRP